MAFGVPLGRFPRTRRGRRGRPLRPSGVRRLVLLCLVGCSRGGVVQGPSSTLQDAGTAPDTNPDTDPICGTNQPFCREVPYLAVPGANECDPHVYTNPADQCSCDCATDVVGCGTHGKCIRRGDHPPECQCDVGGRFVGAHCDQCADGLSGPDCTEGCWYGTVPTDSGCKTLCELAGITCPELRSYCAPTAPARCVCFEGWAEPDCAECVPGYSREVVLTSEYDPYSVCTADCEDCPCGACTPSRRCDTTQHPPACVCRSAYTEVGGDCVWHGMDLKLPTSTASCGDWRFFVMPSQTGGVPDNLSVAAVE